MRFTTRPFGSNSVLRAVAADFFFNCWCLEILSTRTSAVMRKAFDWKGSRTSVLEVEAGPQSCVP
jgi:hypothetical protein